MILFEVGEGIMNKPLKNIVDKRVFTVGGIICLIFLLWTVIMPQKAEIAFSWLLSVFTLKFAWAYLLVVVFFIVFLCYMAFGKYGNIVLGKEGEKPTYSTFSWFFMLFAAGMGIGLVFWSVAEPMSHYLSPPIIEGGTTEAASDAMRYTFTHWGIHPWACYGIIGLPLAYFQFRKGKPALLSSCMEPLIGEKNSRGWMGSIIDIIAIFATVFGVATSLGLGAMQINSGLSYVFGIPYGNIVLLGIITVTTILFIVSSVSGIDKGIKFLSNTNMVIMAVLLIFVFIAGSTLFVTNFFVDSIGKFISSIISTSFWTDPFGQSDGWLNGWTIFYWAWWISWGPFVGGFIARISKGRSIRQFVLGTMLCPVIICFIFICVMGGNAINFDLNGVTSIAEATNENISYALFALLDQLPLSMITSLLAILLICIFFITSADSSTFVCAMMTAKGIQNPPNSLKVFWGTTEGAVAAVLLLVGGLTALQSAAIIAAFPLMIVAVLMSISLVKALNKEIAD